MKLARALGTLWLAGALLWGCERGPTGAPAAPATERSARAASDTERSAQPEHEPTQPAPVARREHRARASECDAAASDGSPLQGELAVETTLELGRGNRCKLVYAEGTVLRLFGPARVRVSPRGEAALLMRQGTLELELAPAALTESSGFWLATPSMRVELVHGARLVVRAHPGGVTDLRVVSGVARVQSALAPRAVPVESGRGLSAAWSGEPRPLELPGEKLEDVRARMLARPSQEGDVSRASAAAVLDLSAELSSAEAQAAEGERLERAHASLPQGDPRAMDLQRQLAQQQGQFLRTRRALLGKSDPLYAWLLQDDLPQRAAIEALLERAARLRP